MNSMSCMCTSLHNYIFEAISPIHNSDLETYYVCPKIIEISTFLYLKIDNFQLLFSWKMGQFIYFLMEGGGDGRGGKFGDKAISK